MDFFQAMRKVLNGESITRDSWDDKEAYVELVDGILTLTNETGEHTWVISVIDMEADDWVVMGELSSD